jgi:DNA-cytosine methyltransferase
MKENCSTNPMLSSPLLKGAAVFKHIGLFEGIGGFSLAARWMGWETVAWCEWNEFGQRILKKHFPKAEGFGDITKTDFKKYANTIDIVTGGFPCQPYSAAGKRLGKEDDRHLWPEMLRAIREIQPSWVVGENVFGLINWNGGLVFHEIQAELEAEGYEVWAYVLPACAKNAPHRRDRIWFVAHAKGQRLETENKGLTKELVLPEKTSMGNNRHLTAEWINRCPDIGTIRTNDGIPYWMDRIKGLGNAIVPQVAYEIFKSVGLLAAAPLSNGT